MFATGKIEIVKVEVALFLLRTNGQASDGTIWNLVVWKWYVLKYALRKLGILYLLPLTNHQYWKLENETNKDIIILQVISMPMLVH